MITESNTPLSETASKSVHATRVQDMAARKAPRATKIQEIDCAPYEISCLRIPRKTLGIVITGKTDHIVNVWSTGSKDPILSLAGHTSRIQCLTLDPQGEDILISGAVTGAIKIWDLRQSHVVRSVSGHKSSCTTVDFHPFGDLFASGSTDSQLKVWDIRRRECIHTYKGHGYAINNLKFSPDGRWVVSGAEDGTIKLWDLTAGKLLHSFKSNYDAVNCLDFHPHEFLLASGSSDGSVNYYDLERFDTVDTAQSEEVHSIQHMCFTPDGRVLLTASLDAMKVWAWEPTRRLDTVVVPWTTVGDICVQDGRLIGGSIANSRGQIWVMDLAKVAPFSREEDLPSKAKEGSYAVRKTVSERAADRKSPARKESSPIVHDSALKSRRQSTTPIEGKLVCLKSSCLHHSGSCRLVPNGGTTPLASPRTTPQPKLKTSSSYIPNKSPAPQGSSVSPLHSVPRQGVRTSLGSDVAGVRSNENRRLFPERLQSVDAPSTGPATVGKVNSRALMATVSSSNKSVNKIRGKNAASEAAAPPVMYIVPLESSSHDSQAVVSPRYQSRKEFSSLRTRMFSDPSRSKTPPPTASVPREETPLRQTPSRGDGRRDKPPEADVPLNQRISRSHSDHATFVPLVSDVPAGKHQSHPESDNSRVMPSAMAGTSPLVVEQTVSEAASHSASVAGTAENTVKVSDSRNGNGVSSLAEAKATDSAIELTDMQFVGMSIDGTVKASTSQVTPTESTLPMDPDSMNTELRGDLPTTPRASPESQLADLKKKEEPLPLCSVATPFSSPATQPKRNSDKRIDVSSFLPRGVALPGNEAAAPDLSDSDAIAELLEQHSAVQTILRTRLTNVKVVKSHWTNSDLRAAVEAMDRLADLSVIVDVLSTFSGAITLDMCILLLPMLQSLLNSPHDRHVQTGLTVLTDMLTNFGDTIRSTRSAQPAPGVDIQAEQRKQKCESCYVSFQALKQHLTAVSKRGGSMGEAASRLHDHIQQL